MTPTEKEVTFFPEKDSGFPDEDSVPEDPQAPKVTQKPASFSLKQLFSPKAQPLMSMKPRVPDMSLPFPKKVSVSAPTPSGGTSTDAGLSPQVYTAFDAVTQAVKQLAGRMETSDRQTEDLRAEMVQAQQNTANTLASLEKAMVTLANAQAAQAVRMSAPAPAPAPAPALSSTPAPAPGPASLPPAIHTHGTGSYGPHGGLSSGGTIVTGPGGRERLPPTRLLGVDKSKEKDELFKIPLRSEAQLKRDMSPPGVSAATRDDLAANMVDAVSLPGTFSGSEETSALDGTHQVAEAMRELMAQSRGDATSERVRVDHGWRSARRISLNAVKNAEQLQTQYGNLTDISDEVVSHFVQITLAILQAGRLTDYAAEQWSQNGFYSRLVRDSVTWYTDLHLHLLNIHLSHGWERVQVELKYHSNKLGMIRTSASNRLVCLCKTYCYLRNGKRSQWTNDDLLSKRIDYMSLSINKAGKRIPKKEVVEGNPNLCRKCRTNCHGPDVPCPWKNLKDADARKAASAWMLNPVAPP